MIDIKEIRELCERAKVENDYSEPVYGSDTYQLIVNKIPALLDELEAAQNRPMIQSDQIAVNLVQKIIAESERQWFDFADDRYDATIQDFIRFAKEIAEQKATEYAREI